MNPKVERYIREYYDPSGYKGAPQKDAPINDIAVFILKTFRKEKFVQNGTARAEQSAVFRDWCQGLPSLLDTCYYYSRSAVQDLMRLRGWCIQYEDARDSEDHAEKLVTATLQQALMDAEYEAVTQKRAKS